MTDKFTDGIRCLLPREKMVPEAVKLRDTYDMKPDAPLIQREFGFYSIETWQQQGMPVNADQESLFGFDKCGSFTLKGLGWCEGEFYPKFEEKVLEDRGDYELVQDTAGRGVLCFKDRRSGFMPEYQTHPVKDMQSWEENCKWRLDPAKKGRYRDFSAIIDQTKKAAGEGKMITQMIAGGCMYLRSLFGPMEVLYAFYDMPDVIHDCMQTWLKLADEVISRYQQHVTLDELFIAEDICYNHGPLYGPETIKEFLLPYYQQLIANIRKRQLDRNRHLFIQVDTDGFCDPIIPLYIEGIGMDCLSPFEAASGCDVVRTGQEYPELRIFGGFDKRILAESTEAIDGELERIIPPMKKRGGYILTCDHGVPAEVPYENYLHFRKRAAEMSS